MAHRIGIDQNSVQRIVSGARVAFDTRTTEEVEKTRDPANRKRRGGGSRRKSLDESVAN